MSRSYKNHGIWNSYGPGTRKFMKRMSTICNFRRDKSFILDEDYVSPKKNEHYLTASWELRQYRVRQTTKKKYIAFEMWNAEIGREIRSYPVDWAIEMVSIRKYARKLWNK